MNKLHKFGLAVTGSIVAMVGMATAAFATPGPLDGVTTEVNDAKTELSSFVTGTAVPVLFGLLILGVGIALAVKYVRRGARAA